MTNKKLFRVLKLRPENGECYSIIVEKPKGFEYQAGDCVYLSFPDKLTLGKQTYSFASSPHEDFLLFTFKKGYSEFKHQLEMLYGGSFLQIVQFGSNFIFDVKKESIMIAGGVGITPLRSMIKTRLMKSPDITTHLIYLNKTNAFPFQKELESWEKEFSALHTTWLVTDKVGRLSLPIISDITKHPRAFDYYIAGPPLMIDATIDILISLEVDTGRIHTDSFDGYIEEL